MYCTHLARWVHAFVEVESFWLQFGRLHTYALPYVVYVFQTCGLRSSQGVFLKSNFEDELDQTLSASTNNSDADTHGNERDSASGLRGTVRVHV